MNEFTNTGEAKKGRGRKEKSESREQARKNNLTGANIIDPSLGIKITYL